MGQTGGSTNVDGVGGQGTANQGFKGGDTSRSGGLTPSYWGGGGGGGAGAAGAAGVVAENAANSVGGNGGIGVQTSISGTATYYAGGGGGISEGNNNFRLGGLGGGGKGEGASNAGSAGTANTGGGAGGNFYSTGRTGGSGIIILKYPNTVTATFSGGVTQSTVTSGAFKISTITAAGVSDTVSWA
jgi:hypothetical protein